MANQNKCISRMLARGIHNNITAEMHIIKYFIVKKQK